MKRGCLHCRLLHINLTLRPHCSPNANYCTNGIYADKVSVLQTRLDWFVCDSLDSNSINNAGAFHIKVGLQLPDNDTTAIYRFRCISAEDGVYIIIQVVLSA